MSKKVLFIDSRKREITEVEWDTTEDLQKLLGGHIEIAASLGNGDTLYVDEEGLLKPNDAFFTVSSLRPDQAFAGHGVLTGAEQEGLEFPGGYTTHDPKTSIATLRKMVKFYTRAEMFLHFGRSRGER